MVRETVVLYGLHERFVVFPYRQGAKRSRLLVRAVGLRRLCQQLTFSESEACTFAVGWPLVLGELLNAEVAGNSFVPVILTGVEVNALRGKNVSWAHRYHRAWVSPLRKLAFHSGTKHVFATKTAFYDHQLLLELTEEPSHESKPRARLP